MSKLPIPNLLLTPKERKTDMSKADETVLEIDLGALRRNFHYLKSKLNEETKFLAVVKAYGYGSDPVAIANTLAPKVDYFAVAYTDEGAILRNNGITKPVLVLHSLPVNYDMMVQYNLEPSIYSLRMLDAFIEYAALHDKTHYPIHLKFNTGLNRLGFEPEEIPQIIKRLTQTSRVKVASIFSHLAASEDMNEKEFTQMQIEKFKTISETMVAQLEYRPILHCTNTSGILNYPEAHFDMVRSGIGLYGFGNSKIENQYLTPIATLKTVISQTHLVKKGDSIGYNRGYIAPRDMRSATLPLGHADGIPRSYGKGKGWVVINGQKAPFIGNVCMDMLMVDVTDIDCDEGDEVIVFGKENTAEMLSAAIQSISYELITAISQRIKRKFVDE